MFGFGQAFKRAVVRRFGQAFKRAVVRSPSVSTPIRQTKKTTAAPKNDFEIRTRYGSIIANERGLVMVGLIMATVLFVAMLSH